MFGWSPLIFWEIVGDVYWNIQVGSVTIRFFWQFTPGTNFGMLKESLPDRGETNPRRIPVSASSHPQSFHRSHPGTSAKSKKPTDCLAYSTRGWVYGGDAGHTYRLKELMRVFCSEQVYILAKPCRVRERPVTSVLVTRTSVSHPIIPRDCWRSQTKTTKIHSR